MAKRKRKIKTQVARTPEDLVRYKKLFIHHLQRGASPKYAAKLANVSHTAAYNWKHSDSDFAKDWRNAMDMRCDDIQHHGMKRACEYSDTLVQFFLKHHRPGQYGSHERESHPAVRMTLEESEARLLQLGVQLPIIEGDYAVVKEETPEK